MPRDAEESAVLSQTDSLASEGVIGQNKEAIKKLEAMPSQQPGLDAETLETLK